MNFALTSKYIDLSKLPPTSKVPDLRHGYLTDCLEKPVIVNFSHVLRYICERFEDKKNLYQLARMGVRRIAPYLFDITCEEYDDTEAMKKFAQYMKPAACSQVWKNGLVGRKFDWYYDQSASFIVHVPGKPGRFASIGVANGSSGLTDAIAGSGEWTDAYKILPYLTMDGVNENGVYCGPNVVPMNGKEDEQWAGKDIFAYSVVRHVLDNCKTAEEAAEIVASKTYMPVNFHGYSFHFMVCDPTHAFLVEDGVVHDVTAGRSFMTNFRSTGDIIGTDGRVDFDKVAELDPHGSGLERYNIIIDAFSGLTSTDKFRELMTSLNYTKSYKLDTDPFWKTEFAADYTGTGLGGDLKCNSPIEDYEKVIAWANNGYVNRTFGGGTWHTTHTSVYDLEHKNVIVSVREEPVARMFALDRTIV